MVGEGLCIAKSCIYLKITRIVLLSLAFVAYLNFRRKYAHPSFVAHPAFWYIPLFFVQPLIFRHATKFLTMCILQ